MKINVWIKTSKVGSECNDELEVDDDATDAEIEEMAREAAFQMMDWGFDTEEDE